MEYFIRFFYSLRDEEVYKNGVGGVIGGIIQDLNREIPGFVSPAVLTQTISVSSCYFLCIPSVDKVFPEFVHKIFVYLNQICMNKIPTFLKVVAECMEVERVVFLDRDFLLEIFRLITSFGSGGDGLPELCVTDEYDIVFFIYVLFIECKLEFDLFSEIVHGNENLI